eukprot:Sro161_g072611.1  (63) ;mRNA; f:78122-78310
MRRQRSMTVKLAMAQRQEHVDLPLHARGRTNPQRNHRKTTRIRSTTQRSARGSTRRCTSRGT